jgi:hypothetical protein
LSIWVAEPWNRSAPVHLVPVRRPLFHSHLLAPFDQARAFPALDHFGLEGDQFVGMTTHRERQ